MSLSNHHNEYATDVLDRLTAVVDDAAEMSLLSLPTSELNNWLVTMTHLVSRAQGLQFAAIQEAEAAAMSVAYKSRILVTHLAKETNGSATSLGADRSLAMWLNNFPEFHQALLAGDMTRAHLNELRDADNPRTRSMLQRDQKMLVDAAIDFDWPSWKSIVGYWLFAADPDGKLTDPTDPGYGMTVRTRANGDVSVTILMDPVTGEAFLTVHEPEVEKLSKAERDDPNATPLSLRQKNLTALMKVLIRGWRRQDGSEPVPLVNIVMSEKVAEDLLARTFGHETPDADSPLDVDPFELPIAWDDVSNFVRTSLLALGAKTLTRFPHLPVYAHTGRLGRVESAARVATTSDSTDVDRQRRQVEGSSCSHEVNVSTAARHHLHGFKPTTSSPHRRVASPTSKTELCVAAPTTKPRATRPTGNTDSAYHSVEAVILVRLNKPSGRWPCRGNG